MLAWLREPRNLRTLHLCLAIAWMFPGVPLAAGIVYWMPEPHGAFAILVVSLWANAATHISSWQAARTEVKQDIQADNVEVEHADTVNVNGDAKKPLP